ncbi:MAG: OprO/OprP family phosphate-selective porin [Deltaproteobacteria bacterium]|nr:OprO/OprP family phosphate-selective porin [Deltaproteobacteria bacterium]
MISSPRVRSVLRRALIWPAAVASAVALAPAAHADDAPPPPAAPDAPADGAAPAAPAPEAVAPDAAEPAHGHAHHGDRADDGEDAGDDDHDDHDAVSADDHDHGGGDAPAGHKKSKITYKPGRYVQLRSTDGSKLRLRLVVQPMMRFTNVSTLPDVTANMIIRRARLGFDARLPHATRVKFELQIKNMHFGLSNLYGTWKPSKQTEIYAGFIKAPGGLERDTYSFDEPFIERSVLAYFTYDHEMGVKVEQENADATRFWAASVTRTAPPAVDGGDPEDAPVYPPGIDPDDISQSSSKWNLAARAGIAPSRDFEASIHAGSRLRLDDAEPDYGDRVAEPYDSGFVDPRPWYGVNFNVAADVAITRPHLRLMVEGGVRRDGHALAIDLTTGAQTKLDGNLNAEMGYVVFGWTPHGEYGAAVDNAPLHGGWEIITRLEGARVKPADKGAITFVGLTTGVHWEPTPQVRLQADLGLQKYNKNAEDNNTDATREILQLWASWRL